MVFFDQDLAGVQVAFNDGTNNESFVYDTEIGDTGTDVRTFAEAFKTWANHGDRGWSGTLTFDYAFTTFGVNHGLTLTVAGGPGAWTPNTAAIAALHLPSGTTAMGSDGGSLVGTAGIIQTLSNKYAFRRWRQMKGNAGTQSSGGSWQNDPMHARKRTADVFAEIKQSDLYAMTLATRGATTPRRAVFYDWTASTFRQVYVAEVRTTIGARQIHRVDLTVIEV